MGKVVGGLLGGSAKTSGGSSTTNSEPWIAAQPYLKDLFAKAQTAQAKLGTATMPTNLTAGFTDNQIAGQTQRLNAGADMQAMLPGMQSAYATQLGAADLDNNPYFQKAIQAAINPVVQNFDRSMIPGLEMNAIANSGYGSSRHGVAEGIARSDLNRQLLDTTSTMANNAYNQGMQLSQNALQLSPTMFANMMVPGSVTSEVGAEQQALQQRLLDDALATWNFDTNKEMSSVERFANVLRGTATTGGNSTTTTSPQSSSGGNVLGNLLGAASAAKGLGLFSDERLKADIKPVAKDARGFQLYSYSIFGRDAFGVLAQEIRKLFPSCVMETAGGLLMVDYEQLGRM